MKTLERGSAIAEAGTCTDTALSLLLRAVRSVRCSRGGLWSRIVVVARTGIEC